MSRAATVPVSSRMRSASVDLPWSMCAMMEKLRMWSSEVTTANDTGSRRGGSPAWAAAYTMLASLDGYVADERGEFGWAEPDEEVHRFDQRLGAADHRHVPANSRMYEVMAVWDDPAALAASVSPRQRARDVVLRRSVRRSQRGEGVSAPPTTPRERPERCSELGAGRPPGCALSGKSSPPGRRRMRRTGLPSAGRGSPPDAARAE